MTLDNKEEGSRNGSPLRIITPLVSHCQWLLLDVIYI